MSFTFEIRASDRATSGRAGVFTTPHGVVETPAFMPVGTLAAVKALDPLELRSMGVQMLLANAYHLNQRPGEDIVAAFGGLHRFMSWDAPILTDSGGFQVFSLAGLRSVSEDGVGFQSHVDGSTRFYTPEQVIRIQRRLGADIIMQFDHVIPGQSDLPAARDASERSIRWLQRCLTEFGTEGNNGRSDQALFPVLQGGIHPQLREESARVVGGMHEWQGFGIGGLSVGERKDDMYAMLEVLHPVLPARRPRYLMGVGFPEDLVEGVRRGVDMFDCVAPTRMGRNGTAFTSGGRINVRNAAWRLEQRPLDEDCTCSTCTRYSLGYLRHLFVSDEMLGARLLSLHNVHFLVATMRAARQAIFDNSLASWSDAWLRRYHNKSQAHDL